MGLGKFVEAVGHIARGGKNIAHIMKQYRAQIVTDKRKRQRRSTQLQIVEEERFATQWEAGGQVSRAGLIDAESTMGGGSPGKEALRQRREVRLAIRIFNA